MKKRLTTSPSPSPVDPEESAFQVGVLVQYYEFGTRYGHIDDIDLDDDGDLYVAVQPIGPKKGIRPRKLWFKSKELKIMS